MLSLFQESFLPVTATQVLASFVVVLYVSVTFRTFLTELRRVFTNRNNNNNHHNKAQRKHDTTDDDSTTIDAADDESSSVTRHKKNDDDDDDTALAVIPCLRNRQSIFPNSYCKNPPTPIAKAMIQSLLDAALWSPFHSKCYKDSEHPFHAVILGKKAMVEMQHVTLDYYDQVRSSSIFNY